MHGLSSQPCQRGRRSTRWNIHEVKQCGAARTTMLTLLFVRKHARSLESSAQNFPPEITTYSCFSSVSGWRRQSISSSQFVWNEDSLSDEKFPQKNYVVEKKKMILQSTGSIPMEYSYLNPHLISINGVKDKPRHPRQRGYACNIIQGWWKFFSSEIKK